jgi:diacylglycerol kinase family enzyme
MSTAFFTNPHSSRVAKKGSRISTHAPAFGAKVYDLARFEALPGQVRAALGEADLFVIEGGDGTVQCVMSEVLRQVDDDKPLPDFTIASGGMTNQVAKVIGMRRVSRSGLKGVKQSPDILDTRLLKLTAEGIEDQYGFLFSTGAVPMVTEYAKDELHARGIGGSAAVAGGLIKAVTSDREALMPATDCDLRIDETHLSGPHLGTVATTLPTITMGLDPFWGVGKGDLRLTYVDGQYKGIIRHVAGVWVGFKDKDRSPDGFHSFNAETAYFNYSGPVMMDGEPLKIPQATFQLATSRPVRIRR